MLSDTERCSVSWQRGIRKILQRGCLALIVSLNRNLSVDLRQRKKPFGTSVVPTGTQWIQLHSAITVQAVQINGRVITWSNVVSYLAWIIVNGNWRQVSVKRIRLYIKEKGKIGNTLGHKEHSTHSFHPHYSFLSLPQILTPLPAVYFIYYTKLFNTVLHLTDYFTFRASIIFVFLNEASRPLFRSWSLFHEDSRCHSDIAHSVGLLQTSDQTLRTLPDNHNIHKRQTSMPSVGIETPIPASERTQTDALDSPATGTGFLIIYSLHQAIHST